MKTAEEVAEETAPCWQPTVKDCRCPMHTIRPSIAKALTAFAEEQGAEVVNTAVDLCNAIRAEKIEEARNEALEEALKILSDLCVMDGCLCENHKQEQMEKLRALKTDEAHKP